MNLQETKSAVESEQKVYGKSFLYEVVFDGNEYFITCKSTNHKIGLVWEAGRTMDGKEQDFFMNLRKV